jgi:hypothetical protein
VNFFSRIFRCSAANNFFLSMPYWKFPASVAGNWQGIFWALTANFRAPNREFSVRKQGNPARFGAAGTAISAFLSARIGLQGTSDKTTFQGRQGAGISNLVETI